MVVGLGVGGSVVVEGNILGGTEGIIVENSSGRDEIDPIDTSTTLSRSSKSSSSSTASPTPYNIYPKQDSTPSQQSAFARNLEQISQPGSASELSRNPVVRSLNADQSIQVNLERESAGGTPPAPSCPSEGCSHRKRDGTILMQQDARDDLKLISRARGVELPGYAYDSRGGQGITVYVIDTGINPDHPEFRNLLENMRWLYLPDEPETQGDELGHGTCVTSKVAGLTLGVAMSANLVAVKIPLIDGMIHVSRFIAAWGVVARDIDSNDLPGRSVVSVAMADDRAAYITGLEDLIDLDAVLVVAPGNVNTQSPVVVGGVHPSGIYAPNSKGFASDLTVAAVGRIFCATGHDGVSEWEGTSFAAPAVAGLAAYLMSLDQSRERLLVPRSVARNVRDLIKSLAYARRSLQPAVIWNGIDSTQVQCPVRRDTGPSGCSTRNVSSPTVPPGHPGHSSKVTMTSSSMLVNTVPSNPPPLTSVAVELSESSRVGNSDITRSNELLRVATRESNELLNESDPANHIGL